MEYLHSPYTAGVTNLTYAYASEVTGGTPLFYTVTGSVPFVAYDGRPNTQTPEPTSVASMGLGVLSVGALMLRRRRSSK